MPTLKEFFDSIHEELKDIPEPLGPTDIMPMFTIKDDFEPIPNNQ